MSIHPAINSSASGCGRYQHAGTIDVKAKMNAPKSVYIAEIAERYAPRTPLHLRRRGPFQSRHAVRCPKCQKENELPTRPLRFSIKQMETK